ncbi:MAG: hypothetical protein HY721_26495, partial [Planctomycetes bacterium]|nr:hypothetical protein [Planctomycetota bacterium]
FGGPRAAAGLSAPLVLVAALLVGLRGLAPRPPPSPPASPAPRRQAAARVAPAAIVLPAIAFAAGVGVPMVFLALRAGPLRSYVAALVTAGAQVLASLEVALWGTGILLALGAAYAVASRGCTSRVRAAAEAGLLLALVLPGAVTGLGLLALEARGVPPWSALYPHPAAVGYAAACRYAALPALVLAGALDAVAPRVRQSGAASGAGPLRVALRLVLPLLLPSILAAAALAYVLSFGELSAAVLVAPPGGMTLPVRIASLLHFGEDSTVAALCLMGCGFALGLALLA